MVTFLAGLGLVATQLILLVAFVGHLRRPGALRDAVHAQNLLPSQAGVPTALMVTLIEGSVPAVAIVGLIAGESGVPSLRAALLAAGLIFSAYAVYSYVVLRRAESGTVPCGCSARDIPLTGWVVWRAGGLAVLAFVSAPGIGRLTAIGASTPQLALVLLAGATFALLLWQLPIALVDPMRATPRSRLRAR